MILAVGETAGEPGIMIWLRMNRFEWDMLINIIVLYLFESFSCSVNVFGG